MKTSNKISICVILAMFCLSANAQTDKGLIRQGNKDFKNSNYTEAEVKYRKSLEKEYNLKAEFNLGDALYEQKNYEEATKVFSNVTERNTSKDIDFYCLSVRNIFGYWHYINFEREIVLYFQFIIFATRYQRK